MSGFYSRAALREARQERQARIPGHPCPVTLAEVPADAPYEDPEAVLHVWLDDKFVPYAKCFSRSPISVGSAATDNSSIPTDATCVVGDCTLRIWLVRDGDRWLMFAGSHASAGRRRDFASPFLGHAIRTAEFWYGAPPTAGARRARETAATAKPRISIHRISARRRRRMADVDGLARCGAEIASAEALLLAGPPDIQGLLLALSDWTQEKRLIQDEIDCRELTK